MLRPVLRDELLAHVLLVLRPRVLLLLTVVPVFVPVVVVMRMMELRLRLDARGGCWLSSCWPWKLRLSC